MVQTVRNESIKHSVDEIANCRYTRFVQIGHAVVELGVMVNCLKRGASMPAAQEEHVQNYSMSTAWGEKTYHMKKPLPLRFRKGRQDYHRWRICKVRQELQTTGIGRV